MTACRLRVAVLISGRGTNMAAIARACAEEQVSADLVGVLADRAEAGGLALARELGLPAHVVPFREHADRGTFERALTEALVACRPDVVALAGFMRILSAPFVAAWPGRMLNVHPSLLPRHPGLHTHRRVLDAGDREHGASVHYVTAALDGGPVVLQSRLAVVAGESAAELSARVQRTEHIIYPRVLGWLASGRLVLSDDRPILDGVALHEPVMEDFA
jgi:phosphoribosylglycinamide formyltransferase 1